MTMRRDVIACGTATSPQADKRNLDDVKLLCRYRHFFTFFTFPTFLLLTILNQSHLVNRCDQA